MTTEPLAGLLSTEGVEEVLPADLLDALGQLLDKISETEVLHQDFTKRCQVEITPDHNVSVFYNAEATELKENFQWFPNTLYSLGIALDECNRGSNSILAMLTVKENTEEISQTYLEDNKTNSSEEEK